MPTTTVVALFAERVWAVSIDIPLRYRGAAGVSSLMSGLQAFGMSYERA
jgi:hypothetical protein